MTSICHRAPYNSVTVRERGETGQIASAGMESVEPSDALHPFIGASAPTRLPMVTDTPRQGPVASTAGMDANQREELKAEGVVQDQIKGWYALTLQRRKDIMEGRTPAPLDDMKSMLSDHGASIREQQEREAEMLTKRKARTDAPLVPLAKTDASSTNPA